MELRARKVEVAGISQLGASRFSAERMKAGGGNGAHGANSASDGLPVCAADPRREP